MTKNNLLKVLAIIAISFNFSACSTISSLTAMMPEGNPDNVDTRLLKQSGDHLVKSYGVAMDAVVASQANIARALNLDNEIIDLQNQQKALKSGNITAEGVEKSIEISESVNKKIQEAMKNADALDSRAKQELIKGLGNYIKSIGGVGLIAASALEFTAAAAQTMADAPLADKKAAYKKIAAECGVAKVVAQEMPALLKNMKKAATDFIDYAKNSGIEVESIQNQLTSMAGF